MPDTYQSRRNAPGQHISGRGSIGNASGAFTNPVIAGMHPDPSVCRAGDDYFLACSSFEYVPGVPIFHNRDLVHWKQFGNALDRASQLSLPPATPSSGGIYVLTLRHYDGRSLITTNVAPGGGTMIFTGTDPAGPGPNRSRYPGRTTAVKCGPSSGGLSGGAPLRRVRGR